MSLYTTMMDSTGTLKRPTITRDSHEGVDQNPFSVVISNIVCSVQPASMGITTPFGQREGDVDSVIYFTQSIGAITNDIVETNDADGNTRTFMVIGQERKVYNRPLSPYEVHCKEQI